MRFFIHTTPNAGRCVRAALLATTLTLAAMLSTSQAWASTTAQETDQALNALNTNFRELYQARTAQVLERLPLILVVQNSAVTVVRGTQRHIYAVPIQRYNDARSIMHAVLGFHGLMTRLAQAGNDAQWGELQTFIANLQQLKTLVGRTELNRLEQARVDKVLHRLNDYAATALAKRRIDLPALRATLQAAEPDISAITLSIGRAHAAAMSDVLRTIRAQATPEEWAQVVAVITGPSTPRRNNLETAIVASVLGKQLMGTRIFYSENIFSVDGALAYLQTLAGDQELSENVFNQPYQMWQDLFTPVSRELIEVDFYTDLAQP
ncbi:hypothetical protein PuT2_00810 [Pusillimonas sp. T2]|uniref:hypothetical protein n=1 Tax=Pusillimonas sp. T2 TaxID=1548123 RepID=UPI000B9D2F97|nr:hypothetical protein [Pusillimonas sp. T2]OXR50446.1 hypothetical protein PuT2_00810 [Pusillimonas sp. T2]